MSLRGPILQLSPDHAWLEAVDQAGDGSRDDPEARAQIVTLARLAADVLSLARPLSGGATPPSPSYLRFRFRPALDAVAGHLTRHYSVDGVVQPPRTYPGGWLDAMRRVGEAVRAAQMWETGQESGSNPGHPLPRVVLPTLEEFVPYLESEVRAFEAGPKENDPATDPTAVPSRRPCYDRDHLWLGWHRQGLGPAKIRDLWNAESPDYAIAQGASGRATVKQALRVARNEEESR
jgi:hypothetical protein